MKTERQIIEECKKLLEQNEPFQRKMKAKHSRMKKRVIGHGGQSNTPPYSEKPSMKRSKSAPPIGENVYYIDEGLFDFFKKKEQPKQREILQYSDYNKMHDRIYIGSAPIDKGRIMPNVLENPDFDKIYIMSNQVADVLKNYYSKINEKIPEKIVLEYAINDTEKPTKDEISKLRSAGDDAVKFLQQNSNSSVLFTCSHGLNRSATGACLTAMSLFGMSADEAINKAVQARGEKALTYPGKKPQQHPFTNILRGNNNINESLGKKLLGMGAAATLALGGIKAGAATQYNTQQNKPEVTQQYQQNDINQEFEKNEKKYNIFSEYNLEDPRNMKQFKQNFFNAFGYKDDAQGNEIFDLFVKEIHYGTMEASAVLSILSTTAGVHKTADPTKTDKEIFSIAYVDLVQNQAIGAYKLAQENNITNAASKLKNYRKRFEY